MMGQSDPPHAGEQNTPGARLKVFYDGQCPVCQAMRRRYERADGQGRLLWLDLNAHLAELDRVGVSREVALARLHVIGADGRIQRGAAAVFEIWRRLPQRRYRWLGAVLRLPGILALAEPLYDFFARHRPRNAC